MEHLLLEKAFRTGKSRILMRNEKLLQKKLKNPLTKSFSFGIINKPSNDDRISPSGGIGRRTGLKILRGNTRTGSIPVSGTSF